jgi:E3 SUMO-protein ligase RanBP2
MTDRIAALERMLETRPDDARLRFGLALEYEKAGRVDDAISALQRYLAQAEDQGNAWGRLGGLLAQRGRSGEARAAYQQGIAQATKHGHPSMAAELAASLEELDSP